MSTDLTASEPVTREQTVLASNRRLRLRQAAMAYAGLGILGILIAFFGRAGPRGVAWVGLGAVFILASAMLVALDARIRGVQLSTWVARLLILPSAWAMVSSITFALVGYRLQPLQEQTLFPALQMQQPAALVNSALLALIIVVLARAGFGRSPTQTDG